MLAAGAPVALHWIADRQSGPLILRVGTDEQKKIIPQIAAGEAFFCIAMSKPNVGSDLASVRTTAAKVQGGYVANGTNVWTSVGQGPAMADRALYSGKKNGVPPRIACSTNST